MIHLMVLNKTKYESHNKSCSYCFFVFLFFYDCECQQKVHSKVYCLFSSFLLL